MINLYNLRTKIRDFILPETSYKIVRREKIVAMISPEPHYIIISKKKEGF